MKKHLVSFFSFNYCCCNYPLEIQNRVEKIRGKFHKKVDDIQVLKQEVLDTLNGIQAFSEELKALKKEKISLLSKNSL